MSTKVVSSFEFVVRAAAVVAVGVFAGCGGTESSLECNPQCEPGQDFCTDLNSGARVNPDCTPYCPPGAVCDPVTNDNNTNGGGNGNGNNTNGNNVNNNNNNNNDNDNDNDNGGGTARCVCFDENTPVIPGEDSDGDCISDENENASGNSDPNNADTDGDGVRDGCEDKNYDGQQNREDTDPRSRDTDGDGLEDGQEDANQNGIIEPGETSGADADSDNDGIDDGDEDFSYPDAPTNGNGRFDPWVPNDPAWDVDQDGCYTRGVDNPGETSPTRLDSDDDGILDAVEDRNGNGECDLTETCAFIPDTDCDGILDGKEDLDADGVRDPFETDPLDKDTDNDGLEDGVEDADQNGVWDPFNETNPRDADTDGDGLPDGREDGNRNGVWDMFTDTNGDGCYNPMDGDLPGESNPRNQDTDGDGISDRLEDANQDGLCTYGELNLPFGGTTPGFEETCAYVADTDCDGIADGIEDATRNGIVDEGELDPRNPDSDGDGLTDGCRAGSSDACEDANNDGRWDRAAGETNPRSIDTDRDGLDDGCEVARFMPAAPAGAVRDFPDPLNEDTDGDGERDGDEDENGNCMTDGDETDPRVFNEPPMEGTEERIRFEVCSAQNVKRLTFAESIRLDYRLAFEVEKNPVTDEEAEYFSQAFGFDGDGLGFDPLDTDDQPIGHYFQSPAGVIIDEGTSQPINRDIYGFIVATEDGRELDVILDELREELIVLTSGAAVETAAVTARPAHDDLPSARIVRAQRELEFTFQQPLPTVLVRNLLLENSFLDTSLLDQSIYGQPDSPEPPPISPPIPSSDVVYGNISCATTPELCTVRFNASVAAVQRQDQLGENGQPITLLVLAITPDDRVASPTTTEDLAKNRLYPERLIRLEDLTGGSAVARFAAETSTTCEEEQQTLAKADVLWVVDDSRSMQQIIDKLQQAAAAAQTVFTANSNIVDYRLAMTTTNPAQGIRRICPVNCREDGTTDGTTACDPNAIRPTVSNPLPAGTPGDGVLGCLNVCPQNCSSTCTDDGGTCDAGSCIAGCVEPGDLAPTIAADAGVFPLPGGGGTFYYEDSLYMDCSSLQNFGGLDSCGLPEYLADFSAFYDGSGPLGSRALTGNAGFIGANTMQECADITSSLLQPVDLSDDTAASAIDCSADPEGCCARLTEVCEHGPTVLASQMCDLIRAMGGKPRLVNGFPDPNSRGRRPHSAPELGVLQARRLLTNALPAVPEDLAAPGQLRLNCQDGDPNCPAAGCNPGDTFAGSGTSCNFDVECGERERCQKTCGDGAGGGSGNVCFDASDCPSGETCGANGAPGTCTGFCDIVPVLTLFLSDEEDFYFKDECVGTYTIDPGEGTGWDQIAAGVADKRQLANDCRYVDGDPRTIESCTATENYCDPFSTGLPAGYDPNFAPDYRLAATDFTARWRDPFAPECSPANWQTSCALDPCALATNQTDCEAPQITACAPSDPDCETPAARAACTWDGAQCTSICQPFNGLADVDDAEGQCNAEPACSWNADLILGTTPGDACQFAYPLNDCQPCKRLRRRREAVRGGDGLVGLGRLGPVYAITRNRGFPGAPTQDGCEGGSVTWGRGDGSAYRDIAIDTLGRTQDVCADSYQGFVQDVVRDIVSLSAPYPLNGFPISATIRVGIGRDTDGNGSFEFFEVPRSRTSGFTFDPTTNSIGFKSDPIDGVCDNPGVDCQADGVIEPEEVTFALNAPQVPQQGDIIYISYRFWEPVPCEEECGDGQTCVRVLCPDEGNTGLSCAVDNDCTGLNEICDNNQCVLDCTPGDTIDRCIDAPCGVCEEFNQMTGQCIPIADTCECNPDPNAIFCDDGSTCPPGLTCLEDSCVCTPVSSCADDIAEIITGGGLIANQQACDDLTDCCADIEAQDAACRTLADAGACAGNSDCVWNGTQCVSAEPLCCPAGDTFECQRDPESPFFFTTCVPGACSCEFPDASSQAGPGGSCTSDADCALECVAFEPPNCPPGCAEGGSTCINASGSSGPDPAFQPRVCDSVPGSLSQGSCICNFDGFYCDPNTPIGCDCRARPF